MKIEIEETAAIECDLKDLKGEGCLKLELEDTSVNMKQCISTVKGKYDDIKLEDQELASSDSFVIIFWFLNKQFDLSDLEVCDR